MDHTFIIQQDSSNIINNNYSDQPTTSQSYSPITSQYNIPMLDSSNSSPLTNNNYPQYSGPQQHVGNASHSLGTNPSHSEIFSNVSIVNDKNIFPSNNYSDQPTTSTYQSYLPIISQYNLPVMNSSNSPPPTNNDYSQYIDLQHSIGNTSCPLYNINPSRLEIFSSNVKNDKNIFPTPHTSNNCSDQPTTSDYPPVTSQYNIPVMNNSSNSPPHINNNYSQHIDLQHPVAHPLNINHSRSDPQHPIGSPLINSSNITTVNSPQSEILSFDIPGYKIIVIPTPNSSNTNSSINPPIFSFDFPGFKIIAILNLSQ